MNRERLQQLAENLNDRVNSKPSLKFALLYLLYARQAAGLEKGEPKPDLPDYPSMGQLWELASQQVDQLAEQDPNLALDLAVTLISLPSDSEREPIYQWLRGDGPLLLAKPPVKAAFLQSPDKQVKVLPHLKGFLAYDLSSLHSPEKAFQDPNAFLATASMYFGLSLTDEEIKKIAHDSNLSQHLSRFRLRSRQLLFDPFMQRLIRFYDQLPDTQWLAQELQNHQHSLLNQLGLPEHDLVVAQSLQEKYPEVITQLQELLNSGDIQETLPSLLGQLAESVTPELQQQITGLAKAHCGAVGVQIEIWDSNLTNLQEVYRQLTSVLPDQPSRWPDIDDPQGYLDYLRIKFATARILTDSLEFTDDRKSDLETAGLAAYAGTISLPILLSDGCIAVVRFGYSGEEGYQDLKIISQLLQLNF